MTLFPIVERELIVQSRRARTYWARFGLAAVGAAIFLWLLIVAAAGGNSTGQGRSMFLALGICAYAYCCLAGLVATCDSLSEEKREGTLGLLFLTDLRSRDLVFGKLFSHALATAFSLLGIVPMLAMAMLLGGVTLAAVGQMGVVLFSILALSTSIGVAVSAFSRHERKSLFAGVVVLLLFVFWPFLAAITLEQFFFEGSMGDSLDFLMGFSPATGIGLILEKPRPALEWHFWFSIGWTWALALCCLAIAVCFLPSRANDRPASARASRWESFKDAMVFGDSARRRAHRAKLLNKNPFSWLAGREHRKPLFAWALVLLFLGMYLAMAWKLGRFAFELPVPIFFLLMPHFIFKIWVASEVAQRGIEDRRSGALELLLSCPVDPGWMVRGLNIALARVLLGPILFLVAAELVLLPKVLATLHNSDDVRVCQLLFGGLIVSLFVDLWSLKWIASWRSLFSTSSARTLVATCLRVLLAPWIFCAIGAAALLMLGVLFDRSIVPDTEVRATAWVVLGLVVGPLLFSIPARLNFHHYFRELAARRFDANLKIPFGANLVVENLLWRLTGKGPFRPLESARPAWLKLWWLSAGACIFLVATALMFGSQLYWGRRAEAVVAALRARGEPTTQQALAEMGAARATAPGASQLEVAMRLIKSRGRGFDPNQSFITPANPFLAETEAEAIRDFVAQNKSAMEAVRALLATGEEWDLSEGIDNPFLGSSRWHNLPSLSHLLYLEGIIQALDGDDAGLKRTLLMMLEFGSKLEHSGGSLWMIDYASRRLLWQSSMVLRHLLSRGALSSAELVEIRGRVEGYSDPTHNLGRVREFRTRAIALREGGSGHAASLMGVGKWGPGAMAFNAYYAVNRFSGNFDRIWVQYMGYLDKVEQAVRLPFPERVRQFPNRSFLDPGSGAVANVFAGLLPDMAWLEGWARDGAALQRVLVSALDLEIWRLEHGTIPPSLAELPNRDPWRLDPFDGQPLRLAQGVWISPPGSAGGRPPSGRLTATNSPGYRIYSVGQNLTDDGGAAESDSRNYNSIDVTFTRPDSFLIRVVAEPKAE